MANIQKASQGLKQLLSNDLVKEKIKAVVGKNIGSFTTSIVQITSQNHLLKNANPQSVLGAALTAATLNLPLNNALGYAYLVPFNEKQKDGSYETKAQFILGSKGYIQLAQRSGQFTKLHATDVREGEILHRDRLTGDIDFQWIENEKERNSKKIIGYVSFFRLKNGYEDTMFMTAEEMESHGKKFSQTYKKGFGVWKDDFDSMAIKTILKLLLSKKAPLSIEMQNAITTDQSVIENDAENDIEEISYVDNEKEVKTDPDIERQKILIDSAKTMEDIEFAESHVVDEVLKADLQLKKVQIKKSLAK